MYESATRLSAEIGHDVQEFFAQARRQPSPWSEAEIFATRIRRNIRLAEAPSFGQSILRYAPDCHGAEDYRSLAQEVAALAGAARRSRRRGGIGQDGGSSGDPAAPQRRPAGPHCVSPDYSTQRHGAAVRPQPKPEILNHRGTEDTEKTSRIN